MKTLRSRLFLFISLLLLLPAVPLSVFISSLLDRSYSIGVNPNVEKALDGALKISAEFYQIHRNKLKDLAEKLSEHAGSKSPDLSIIQNQLPGSETRLYSIPFSKSETPGDTKTIEKFTRGSAKNVVWPATDHTVLFALVRLSQNTVLWIKYPLPESFSKHAGNIQEVNQIYKTLGAARVSIRQSFLYAFLTVYGLGLLLALAVSFYISKRITKPIDLLKTATAEFSRGNLQYRVLYKGRDEFRVLADALGTMASELEQNQRTIIELEKMATWQQLARRLAHEIKNPLTPIQLMAQQMRDSYRGEDTVYKNMLEESARIIEDEVGSLKKLVREFSDFARMPEFKSVEQDLSEMLVTLEKLYGERLGLDLPDALPAVKFDYDYLKRALINLIDNAIAASTENDPVWLHVKQQAGKISLSVEDKGSGIEKENLQKIFEPYFSTKRSGVGLGLAIVKKIIEEHGGTIAVESQVGIGTTFLIELPV